MAVLSTLRDQLGAVQTELAALELAANELALGEEQLGSARHELEHITQTLRVCRLLLVAEFPESTAVQAKAVSFFGHYPAPGPELTREEWQARQREISSQL